MSQKIKDEIKWTPDLSVGIGDIDIQHREFISILREIAENIKKNKDKKIEDAISFLEKYAEIHFSLEEMYMTIYSYPASDEHFNIHKKFKEEIKLLREKLIKKNLTIFDMQDKFKNWFFSHIKTTDTKLASFLIKKKHNKL